MSTQTATFTARTPKTDGGATVEHSIWIACTSEEDFISKTIAGPVTAALAGHVQFSVTIQKEAGGVIEILSQTLTYAGQKEDFGEPSVDGPVMVVQDPPYLQAA